MGTPELGFQPTTGAGSPPSTTFYPVAPGYPPQSAEKISNMWSNNQGDNVVATIQDGDTLIAYVIGLKSLDPFDQLHGESPAPGYLQGLNDFNAIPVVTDNSASTPVTVTGVTVQTNTYSVTSVAAATEPLASQLGTAANYALLAYSGITNTGANVITGGNIGSSSVPATLSGMTLTPPAVIDNADAGAARTAGSAAYTYYTGLTFTTLSASSVDLSTSGVSSSNVYHAGNYKAGTSMTMSTGIVLDAQGNQNALFVFWAGSTVDVPSGQSMTLINGAQAENVIWCVGSSFSQSGVAGQIVGNILAYASITFAGTPTLLGRALAVGGGNGDVTFAAGGSVTVPVPVVPATTTYYGNFTSAVGTPPPPYIVTSGATNAFVGLYFTIAGFVNPGNNGTFLCTASSATALVLTNLSAVNETAAGSPPAASATSYVLTVNTAAQSYTAGEEVTLSGLLEPWLDGQIVQVVTGGLTSTLFQANFPTISETLLDYQNLSEPSGAVGSTGGNVWVLLTELSLADADYNVVAVPPTGGQAWPSTTWNLDGYYPCVYVFVCYDANLPAAITDTYQLNPPHASPTASTTFQPPLVVNVNSCYQVGIDPPQDWAGGKPIFDGGVNIIVVPFTNMTSVAADGFSVNISDPSSAIGSNNPALGAQVATTGTGDLVIALALQKSANGLGLGADATLNGGSAVGSPAVAVGGYSLVANGKLVGSEAHYMIEWGIQTAAGVWTPTFANPIGYDTIIAAIALSHS